MLRQPVVYLSRKLLKPRMKSGTIVLNFSLSLALAAGLERRGRSYFAGLATVMEGDEWWIA